jgi:esterase/lipase superfamily enzyme
MKAAMHMKNVFHSSFARTWLMWCAVLLALSGCSSTPQLMPTPNLYSEGMVDPFIDVDPALRSNKVEVLYLTDRQPENDSSDKRLYGFKRSRSLAFGISTVQFGENVSWDDLVKASRTRKRDVDLAISVPTTVETGRFVATPRSLVEIPGSPDSSATDASQRAAEKAFKDALAQQMSHTRVKEVYIFVHGFANTFNDGVTTIAQMWHFFGREGVPIAYTWPAGSAGLLRGYNYDRESSEFTGYHLKQTLKLIASCPEVTKVHIIGHSRGTDVVATAIRELHLEIAGAEGDHAKTRSALKLGTVVLAAPDLDLDVTIQRFATARVGRVPERLAMYVQQNDKALGLANWLFSGATRLGEIKSDMFSPAEIHALREAQTPQIVEARVSDTGAFGHDYFHSNPAVSSDLILLMRYQFKPGSEYGRPLGVNKTGFWLIQDGYPGTQKNTMAESK